MKSSTYLMQQNKILSTNISMQDKVYEIKNMVSLKCVEASRKLQAMSTTNDSVEECKSL